MLSWPINSRFDTSIFSAIALLDELYDIKPVSRSGMMDNSKNPVIRRVWILVFLKKLLENPNFISMAPLYITIRSALY